MVNSVSSVRSTVRVVNNCNNFHHCCLNGEFIGNTNRWQDLNEFLIILIMGQHTFLIVSVENSY